MMLHLFRRFLLILTMLFLSSNLLAHFGAIIPNKPIINDPNEVLNLKLMFFHPFEGTMMNLEKPAEFKVFHHGQAEDLSSKLQEQKIGEFLTHKAEYKFTKPGDYQFYMIPKPYFEPAEECFIVHYSKVIVNFAGLNEGWDQPTGIKAEIIPLSRPYSLWTGNTFQGKVLFNSKEAKNNEVEVEYYNEDKKVSTNVDDALKTQVIKTDANGVFTYAFPRAGWWGFSALTTDKKKLKHEGKDYPIEIGAVLWVYVQDMK